MNNKEIFDSWKEEVEDIEITNKLDCLRIVELNVSNLCNRKCSFCPQSKLDTIESKPLYMPLELIDLIAKQLDNINYQGYICIAGMGEPTLHPHIDVILRKLKDFKVVLVTNGETKQEWRELSKLCQIKVSVHDWKNKSQYEEVLKDTKAIFRNHDAENPDLTQFYNRAGNIFDADSSKENRPCFYPFFKVFIDTDGSYLQCESDWKRETRQETLNILNYPIQDYFLYYRPGRKESVKTGRHCNSKICKRCNINGDMYGKKFVDFFQKENEALWTSLWRYLNKNKQKVRVSNNRYTIADLEISQNTTHSSIYIYYKGTFIYSVFSESKDYFDLLLWLINQEYENSELLKEQFILENS